MSDFALWFEKLGTPQAALIGAIFGAICTLISGLARDFVAALWAEKRAAKRTSNEIFRRYAEPLALNTGSLFWRLKEITSGGGRASYLVATAPRTDFDEYKFRSTVYRVAAVLGCIRAFQRELSFSHHSERTQFASVLAAISDFEKSLADGHHVEMQRLLGLLELWKLGTVDEDLAGPVAVAVERCIDQHLRSSNKHDALKIPPEKQMELCADVATLICRKTGKAVPSVEFLEQTLSHATRQIAIREAWLFRDWQTAIGDIMIREAKFGDRKFEVLGFGDFEDILLSPAPNHTRSFGRIASLFNELNMDKDDMSDARPEAIRNLLDKSSSLILALSTSSSTSHLFDVSLIDAAENSIRDLGDKK